MPAAAVPASGRCPDRRFPSSCSISAETISRINPLLQNISIDYGILERSDEAVALSGQFGWNDIGSWDALGAIFPPDDAGNIIKANHMGIDTCNSIIYGNGRLLTTIGVDGDR